MPEDLAATPSPGGNVIVDEPRVYDPLHFSTQQRFENAEALQVTVSKLENFNPGILGREEALVGVTLAADPEAFFERHSQLVEAFRNRLWESYKPAIARTVTAVATYLGRGDEAATQQWHARLLQRTHALSDMFVADHLVTSSLGDMLPLARALKINSVLALMTPEERPDELLNDFLFPHEIIHLISTGAIAEGIVPTPDGPKSYNARVGLTTVHSEAQHPDQVAEGRPPIVNYMHATWLNEAATEDFRARAFDTEEVGYVRGVALLRALQACDPTLQDSVDRALFDTPGPAEVIGKVEVILGPLAIERLEPLLAQLQWDSATNTISFEHDNEVLIGAVLEGVADEVKGPLEQAFRRQLASMRPVIDRIPPDLISLHG